MACEHNLEHGSLLPAGIAGFIHIESSSENGRLNLERLSKFRAAAFGHFARLKSASEFV
jgi:hypothetical protein